MIILVDGVEREIRLSRMIIATKPEISLECVFHVTELDHSYYAGCYTTGQKALGIISQCSLQKIFQFYLDEYSIDQVAEIVDEEELTYE